MESEERAFQTEKSLSLLQMSLLQTESEGTKGKGENLYYLSQV